MAVIVDGLVFDNTNGPAELPIEAVVDGQLVKLSDGRNQFQDTGLTPSLISPTGVFNHTDTAPAPLDMMDKLAAIRDRRKRVLMRWSRYQWWGLVTRVKATPFASDRVKWEFDFQPEDSGAGAAHDAAARTRRVSTSLDAIGSLSSKAGPSSTTAWSSTVTARMAAGY